MRCASSFFRRAGEGCRADIRRAAGAPRGDCARPDFDQGSYALLLGNSRDEAHRTILWTVLIVTVGFLAMLTLRLVRQGRRTPDGNPQPETSSEQNQ